MRAHCLRFVGGVGWRQNEQTYDALALSSSVIEKTALTYAYVGQVRRIFGQNSAAGKMNVDTHLLNAKVTIKQIIDWETGHWPQEDKPKEVANEISDFLDKVRLTL